jgi:hypothetical protein
MRLAIRSNPALYVGGIDVFAAHRPVLAVIATAIIAANSSGRKPQTEIRFGGSYVEVSEPGFTYPINPSREGQPIVLADTHLPWDAYVSELVGLKLVADEPAHHPSLMTIASALSKQFIISAYTYRGMNFEKYTEGKPSTESGIHQFRHGSTTFRIEIDKSIFSQSDYKFDILFRFIDELRKICSIDIAGVLLTRDRSNQEVQEERLLRLQRDAEANPARDAFTRVSLLPIEKHILPFQEMDKIEYTNMLMRALYNNIDIYTSGRVLTNELSEDINSTLKYKLQKAGIRNVDAFAEVIISEFFNNEATQGSPDQPKPDVRLVDALIAVLAVTKKKQMTEAFADASGKGDTPPVPDVAPRLYADRVKTGKSNDSEAFVHEVYGTWLNGRGLFLPHLRKLDSQLVAALNVAFKDRPEEYATLLPKKSAEVDQRLLHEIGEVPIGAERQRAIGTLFERSRKR